MRIIDIVERTVPISRFADESLPSGGLTTSIVAVITDVVRRGHPVIGFGFSSFGRFGQGGLIRERFAPRLLGGDERSIATDGGGNIDPFKAWDLMLAGEKPGGHGERCVAVGTLDMACWDAAAKIADLPLWRHLADSLGRDASENAPIPVYAGGGYVYPEKDRERLKDEIRATLDAGHTHAKIKIGNRPLTEDLDRINIAAGILGSHARLAVDAIYAYDATTALDAARAFLPLGLWWFEDICDPHDFATQARVTAAYDPPIAAGEALFSVAEGRLLRRHGGLRPDRDILLFDPVHCYGLPGYLQIVDDYVAAGWSRDRFWPHGGHLFTLHVAKALALGGAEVNPFSFHPFGGLSDGATPVDGKAAAPDAPGIGFETKNALARLFADLRRP